MSTDDNYDPAKVARNASIAMRAYERSRHAVREQCDAGRTPRPLGNFYLWRERIEFAATLRTRSDRMVGRTLAWLDASDFRTNCVRTLRQTFAAWLFGAAAMGCGTIDQHIPDQCLRRELFAECMRLLPGGPVQTHYNDWSEVVDECESYAHASSVRLTSQIKKECRR